MSLKLKQYFLAVALSFLASCQEPQGTVVRFCDRSDYVSLTKKMLGREYIDMDLAVNRIYGPDTSDPIRIVRNETYFGMVEPMPLLVPRLDPRAPIQNEIRIQHGSFLVIFHPTDSQAGEFLGRVSRTSQRGQTNPVLTYRYSRQNGVYEIVTRVRTGDSYYDQVLKRCGGVKLFPQAA